MRTNAKSIYVTSQTPLQQITPNKNQNLQL
jgi:hypothetical protein